MHQHPFYGRDSIHPVSNAAVSDSSRGPVFRHRRHDAGVGLLAPYSWSTGRDRIPPMQVTRRKSAFFIVNTQSFMALLYLFATVLKHKKGVNCNPSRFKILSTQFCLISLYVSESENGVGICYDMTIGCQFYLLITLYVYVRCVEIHVCFILQSSRFSSSNI